jgi:mycothiol synthase
MATIFMIDDTYDLENTDLERMKHTGANLKNEHLATGLDLPEGFKLRAAGWADLESVAQLILDECTAAGDPSLAVSADVLREEWKTPGFNLETDAWVITTGEGRVVGYEEFFNRYAHASLRGDGYVHPDYLGLGIGTTLLCKLEERAREEMELAEPEHRVFIRNGLSIDDKVAREMHEAEGYQPIRFLWRMEMDLQKAPPPPVWPDGIQLRPFDYEAHDYLLYRAHSEAFRDHWGHTPSSYEDWQHHMNPESNDTSLWYIAWEGARKGHGDQIAGYCLCKYRMDNAWVGTLGVRQQWRKRGLGLALLNHSFGEFYKRGDRVINLGVDAASQTGATRLYKRAGMRVGAEYVTYEKEIRSGVEPDVEPT